MAGRSATRLEPEWLWTRSYGVLPGIKVGQVINTCGVIPLGAEGRLIGKDDARAQVRKAFENIAEILALGGCAPVFLTSARPAPSPRRWRVRPPRFRRRPCI